MLVKQAAMHIIIYSLLFCDLLFWASNFPLDLAAVEAPSTNG
jgi:hypothetical protein